MRQRIERASLLLWVPLVFYVYSVAYGSVPIFIPQLYPHSYYNSRYGMEMLPALALFACVAAAAVEQHWRAKKSKGMSQGLKPQVDPATEVPGLKSRPIQLRPVYAVVLALAVLNPVAMIYGTDLVQRIASLIERHPSNLMANYSPP